MHKTVTEVSVITTVTVLSVFTAITARSAANTVTLMYTLYSHHQCCPTNVMVSTRALLAAPSLSHCYAHFCCHILSPFLLSHECAYQCLTAVGFHMCKDTYSIINFLYIIYKARCVENIDWQASLKNSIWIWPRPVFPVKTLLTINKFPSIMGYSSPCNWYNSEWKYHNK